MTQQLSVADLVVRCLEREGGGDLPEHVDLAVIAVPAAAVLDAAEQCGRRGVRAVVITSGLDAAAAPTCSRHAVGTACG